MFNSVSQQNPKMNKGKRKQKECKPTKKMTNIEICKYFTIIILNVSGMS
jgi:hypothetical protein